MTKVYVDPDELDRFAADLVALVHDLDDIKRRLETGLQRLSSTWRDQEYDRFVGGFLHVVKLIDRFSEEVRKIHPQLKQDAEYIRDYFRLQKSGG